MPTGVLLLDATGRILDANPEAHHLLDEPLIGERWIDIIKRAFAPQDDDGHEVSLHNGRKVKLAISASSEGQLIFITDMTETRLLQSRLSELQRLSSLGKMVASLAHQVRTPLSSAMLYASHLGSEQLAPATRQRFQGKLVDRLHDLEKQVSDMLLFAKGGDNKVVTRFSLESLLNCLEALIDTLALAGYNWLEASSAEQALLTLKDQSVDIVISDVQMSGMNGLSLLRSIKLTYPKLPVILMTAFANIEDAVIAMREGAVDYMSKPFAPEVLLNLVGRYAPIKNDLGRAIVADEKSKRLLNLAEKVAKTDANVMVLGPSGSGKEVMSRYIHEHSLRCDGPFVAINCAAIRW
ncbi:response regulator [Photobacterium damselae]|uniref:response regulator n=1 Tax=Photobacterium damselae TaxID=38293 RepID=UPI0016519ADC|nr:response regulator [Photobacterium damselae]